MYLLDLMATDLQTPFTSLAQDYESWWTEFVKWLLNFDILGMISAWWKDIIDWLCRPDVIAVITVWWITFTGVMILFMMVGFGPIGIIPGSIAAGFQSFMYGGFTPAGGIFATLTSMAMLGTLVPVQVAIAACIATCIATLVAWMI